MATTCTHGFEPGTCLICQTLEGGPKTATKQVAQGGEGRRGRRAAKAGQSVERTAPPIAVRPDAVMPAKQEGIGLRVMGILFLIILAAVAVWFVFGLVIHILHIVELIAVAVGAGWLGWKLGVHHGRRSRS